MKIIVKRVGMMDVNCYIAYCEKTKICAVIDPGADPEVILRDINNRHLKVGSIVLTHGHFDHIGGVDTIKKHTGARTAIHHHDSRMLVDMHSNLSYMAGCPVKLQHADTLLHDGDEIVIGECSLRVVHTPGHTPGGISLVGEDVVFTGDTLFKGSIGRTDLAGGDYDTLIKSIKNKLITLKGALKLLPGHGDDTDMDYEKQNNPFINSL